MGLISAIKRWLDLCKPDSEEEILQFRQFQRDVANMRRLRDFPPAKEWEMTVAPVVQNAPIQDTGFRISVPPIVSGLGWFCNEGISLSPAEKIIADLLSLYKVSWYREVSFKSFQSSKYGYYRFDFFLPKLGLIIEYDSVEWHRSPERQNVDQIKDSWCNNNGLTVYRFNNKHYYSMATHIDKLMLSHKIYRK